MNKLYTLFLSLCLAWAILPAKAADWTYDCSDLSSKFTGDVYANSSINITLNGLTWHCHGVFPSNDQGYDPFESASMRIYGEVKNRTNPEITVFELRTARDIGTVSFKIQENLMSPSSYNGQVSWIVEWSSDGKSWSQVGDAFQANDAVQEISRTVNQKNAYVRIVRADYATFDYKSIRSNAKPTNFDDFKITDVEGGGPVATTLSPSKSICDFDTLKMGQSKIDTVLVKYTVQDGAGKPTYKLEGADTGTFSYQLVQAAEGVDSLFITAKVQHSGTSTANIAIAYGELTSNISLTVVGTKPRANILFSGGQGTEDAPYRISSKEDLVELSKLVNEGNDFKGKYFTMTKSIDMKTITNFMPIGNQLKGSGADNMHVFSGIFDGGGYSVTNLTEYYESGLSIGLFGIITDATIKNLTLSASKITGQSVVGGIVGYNHQGTSLIENCHVASDVEVKGTNYVAGILGAAMLAGKVTVKGCTNAGTITGCYAAGIMSINKQDGSTVEECGNTGTINSTEYDGGGIMAISDYASTNIINCFNTGAVNLQGTQTVYGGGILGDVNYMLGSDYNTVVVVKNCYNAASFSYNYYLHPILPAYAVVPNTATGEGYDATRLTVSNCYYASDLSSGESIVGVSTLTSTDMKAKTFADRLNQGQSVEYWIIKDGENQGYPVPFGTQTATGISSVKVLDGVQISAEGGKLVVNGQVDGYAIYDLSGKLVTDASLAPGIYVVKINANKTTKTYKIIKR